jgi:lycopene beta-cyclase
VEYTLFSKDVLLQEEYVLGLQQYISSQLNIQEFTITEEEYGVIPMTDHGFSGIEGNIIYIGTAGGQTKASSGYTYQFVQKQCNQIIEKIKTTGNPVVLDSFMQKRFKWYDRVLLNVLYNRKVPGDVVFSLLFKRNSIKRLFSFLDNESKIHQELYLLNTLPKLPFMLSGLEEMR